MRQHKSEKIVKRAHSEWLVETRWTQIGGSEKKGFDFVVINIK